MFHHNDLNAAGVTAHTLPNGSDRAIKARNEALAAQCKADGQEVRELPPEERTAMILTDEQEKLERDLREVTGVTIEENVGKIKEAQFIVKDGQPTIQMPKPEAFQDVPGHPPAGLLARARGLARAAPPGRGQPGGPRDRGRPHRRGGRGPRGGLQAVAGPVRQVRGVLQGRSGGHPRRGEPDDRDAGRLRPAGVHRE